jgi:RNA polymerase sigma factor (sigma-70 family)
VAAAAAGDARALESVCTRHRDDLHRYLLSMLGDREDAQDALQSTWMKAVAALPAAGPRELRAWLFTIAHNEAVDLIRRRRADVPLEAEHQRPGPGVHEIAVEREELAALLEDMAALPARQRSALLLRELGGLHHRAIAEALGISDDSARHAVYEARRALTRCAAARSADCDEIRVALSDGDGRRRHATAVRAHLRACAGCREFAEALRTRPSRLRALLAPFSLLGGGSAMATKAAVVVATVSIAAGGALTLEGRRAEPHRPPANPAAVAPDPAAERAPVPTRRATARSRTRAARPAAAGRSRPATAAPRSEPSSAPTPHAATGGPAPATSQSKPQPAPAAAATPAPPPPDETIAVGTPQQGPVPQTEAQASEDGAGVCVGPCDEEGLPLP